MATIDEVKRLLEYRCSKQGFNSYLSPNDFNLVWNRAERRFFNLQYKKYGANQNSTESLSKFKTDPLPITVDVTGQYTKPTDILHIDSLTHVYNGIDVSVRRVENDRLASHLSSSYDAPSLEFPIYVEYKTVLQFYPITLATAKFVYLQDLADSFWGYTITGNKPVYDVTTSVQPKWSDSDIDEILYIAMSDLGLNMNDVNLQNFASQKIQTGV